MTTRFPHLSHHLSSSTGSFLQHWMSYCCLPIRRKRASIVAPLKQRGDGQRGPRFTKQLSASELLHQTRPAEKVDMKRASSSAVFLKKKDNQIPIKFKKKDLLRNCKEGGLNFVKMHLDAVPADVNAIGMWGNTPLIGACQYRHGMIAMELLGRGALVWIANEEGCTAFHHACLEGLTEVVQEMLMKNIKSRDMEKVHKPGLIYNSRTDKKVMLTPLAAASVNGHMDIIRLLLDCKVYSIVAVEDALKGAIMCEEIDTVELIMRRYGAELRGRLDMDISFLSKACRSENLRMVKVFLDAQCVINACLCHKSKDRAISKFSPLSIACRLGSSEMVEQLLQAGADPNYSCGACSFPLMQACRAGSAQCVSLLLCNGAQQNVPDPMTNMSARQYAINARLDDIVDILNRGS